MPAVRKITPCLWFDEQAEEAMLGMKKLDIAELERAHAGTDVR